MTARENNERIRTYWYKAGGQRIFFLCLILMMFFALLPHMAAAAESTGIYEGTATGKNNGIKVSVELDKGTIKEVQVTDQHETPSYWGLINLDEFLGKFAGMTSADQVKGVDAVSGATLSSNGVKAAICDALARAAAETEISGTGTERDPYVIMNAAQLQEFAGKVDAGEDAFTKAYAVLGADIDLSGIGNWNPIGAEGKASSNKTKLFAGFFDGQGHIISGMKISGEYTEEANLGLFSTLGGTARVSRVVMSGVDINVTSSVDGTPIRAGAIAGDTQSASSRASIVDSCRSAGEVKIKAATSQAFAGGVLGRAFSRAAIINCVSTANVSAETEGNFNAAYAGGIVGMTGNNAVLANCAAFGNADATNTSGTAEAYAGGIAGMLSSATYNVYATGNASIHQADSAEKKYTGIIAGQASGGSLGDMIYYASDAVVSVNGGATATVPYGENLGQIKPDAFTGMSATDMGSDSFADILNANIGTVKKALNEAALDGLYEWIMEGGRPVLSDTLWVPGEVDGSIFAGGSGTKADPYLIRTGDQLRAFAGSLNSKIDYRDTYIKLDADIDLAGEEWTPIGGSFYRFDGDFDGGGHTISGLTLGSAAEPAELDGSKAYVGLFGWINEHARIHDVILDQVAIHTHSAGSAYVGGIAGRANGTDTEGDYRGFGIDSCIVKGVIEHTTDKGTSFIGGIVGHMFKGTIINSWTDVTMTGKELSGELAEVGGIAGLLNRGLVANSYALGSMVGSGYRNTQYDIEGMACVGGIAAVDGGAIANCYAQGSVEALEYSIDTGILAGWVTGVGKAYNCWYNADAGMVIDGRTVSPVDPFGETVAGGVSDEYFFRFPGSLVDKISEYHPAEDAQKLADGLNESFRAFPIDIENVYGLPLDALKSWTVQNGQTVLTDAKAGVTYVQPEVEKNLPEEKEEEMQDGAWFGRSGDRTCIVKISVRDGSVENVKVLQGEESGDSYKEAVARARFKALYGDRSDYEAADTSRFGGSGTAADPYRIETEAQLRYLAESINEDVDWQGVYFRQTKDFSVSGDDWKPIGWGIFADVDGDGFGQDAAALYPFRGSFDGGGHVISGLRAGSPEQPAEDDYMGLFGIIQGDYEGNEIPKDGYRAELKNIRLENIAFYTQNRWRNYIGGLVGNAQGGFTIDHCFVSGRIVSRSAEDFAFAGGLSGSLMYGGVTNCGTNVDCRAWSGKNYSYAAGMSAVTNRATIVNSYALGDVCADADQTNRAEAGGFTGLDGGICINCYARGNVEIASKYSMYLGGFVGMAASSSEHRQCYYNTDADQIVAGKAVAEKRYAGKFVNESAEANAQAQSGEVMSSEKFRTLLEENRQKMTATLSEVRQVLGADNTGSSRYHSLYYNGSDPEMLAWKLENGIVGLTFEEEKESGGGGAGQGGGTDTDITAQALTALQEAIRDARAIQADGFTAETYKALTEAIEAAEKTAADPDATAEQLQKAAAAIANAKAGLVRVTEETDPKLDPGTEEIRAGESYEAGGNIYRVKKIVADSSSGQEMQEGEIIFTKAKNARTIVVPERVKLEDGNLYRVVGIGTAAFKAKKIRIVIVGTGVRTIYKKAFKGSRVRTVILKTRQLTARSVGKSLKGSKVRTVKVRVGNKQMNRQFVKKYKKIFSRKNAGKKVRVR